METKARDHRETTWDPLSVVLLAICVLGLALRLWKIGAESLWFDEWFSLRRAQDPWSVLARGGRQFVSPPLYYLFLKPWVLLLGDSEAAVRLPSALAGAAAIPLLARVGKRLFDRVTGVSTAFLLAVSSYHVRYSQEARMYALLVLLGLLSMEFFLACRNRWTGWNRAGYVLSSAAILYTHYLGGFLLAVQGLAVSVAALRNRAARPALARWAADVSLVALLFVPWIPFFARQLRGAPGTLSWIGKYSSEVMARVIGLFSWPTLLLVAVLIVSGIVLAMRRPRLLFGERGAWLLVSAWFLVPHLGLIVLSLVAFPLYVIRYAMVGLPAVFLAAAAGGRAVRPAALQCAVFLAVGAWSLTVTARGYARADKPQWREAMAWVAERATADDLVLVSGRESEYYVHRQPGLRAAAVLFQSHEDDERWPAGSVPRARVWYVQQANWKTPAPLARGYQARDRREFAQVSVVLFERSAPAAGSGDGP